MTDAAARFAMLLGLVPLSIATFVVTFGIVEKVADEHCVRISSALSTGLVVAFVLLVWHGYVHWTRRRRRLTAGFTALLVLHLVLWLPLWRINCNADEEALKLGQSSTLLGLWCLGCVILWWRPVRLARRTIDTDDTTKQESLTTNSGHATGLSGESFQPPSSGAFRRLAGSLANFPILFGCFIITFLLVNTLSSLSGFADTAVAFGVCLLLGMSIESRMGRARRRERRSRMIIPLSIGVLLTPSFIVAADAWDLSGLAVLAVACTSIMAWAAWLAVTSHDWTNNAPSTAMALQDDGAFREILTCPACAYRLTGLPTVRCPECGWSGTLGELTARTAAACEE